MSRCFPYPPPGYTLSRASNDALIESIKFQKERVKAKKAERKNEKKREKDGKNKLKKEKTKLNNLWHDNSHGVRSLGDSKCGYLQKETKDDIEQLEMSSITEEYGVPRNPSYSSDSIENSNKRKRRHAMASNGTRVQGGNILRIRLPSQKNVQCDINDGEKQLCPTTGRKEIPETVVTRAVPDKTCTSSLTGVSSTQSLPPKPANDLRQLNSHQTQVPAQEDIPSSELVSKSRKKMQRVSDKYGNLFENSTPPSLLVQCLYDDDQGWLFARRPQQIQKHPDVNNGVMNQMSCSSSASLWPSAQYLLPATDFYALPYTIPF